MNVLKLLLTSGLLASICACASPTSQPAAPRVVAKTASTATTANESGLAAANASKPELVVTVPTFPNATCPIMGKPVSGQLFVETPRGRIYVCCKSCNQPVLDDVQKAIETAYPVVKKANLTTCPIMGDPISQGSPTVTVQGVEIEVCCEDCLERVRADDQIVLAKVQNPAIVDLKNKTCPITGEPVARNTFCLVGNTLVHLSSQDCVDAVKKDPAAILAKAKALSPEAAADKSHG